MTPWSRGSQVVNGEKPLQDIQKLPSLKLKFFRSWKKRWVKLSSESPDFQGAFAVSFREGNNVGSWTLMGWNFRSFLFCWAWSIFRGKKCKRFRECSKLEVGDWWNYMEIWWNIIHILRCDERYIYDLLPIKNSLISKHFGLFYTFALIWGNDPIWLLIFRWVETTS